MEKSYIAQVSTSNDSVGSGFIYTAIDHYYVFTAKHVLCGESNEYIDNIGAINIKYNKQSYTIDRTIDVLCLSADGIDLAIIAVEKSRLSNVGCTPFLSQTFQTEINCRISGYPKARANENILSIVQGVVKCDSDDINQLQLEINDPIVYDIEADSLTRGYSGSGVFYENKQGIFALALMFGYNNKIKRVFCVNWNSVNAMLEQHALPLVIFNNIEFDNAILNDIDLLSCASKSLMGRFNNKIGNTHLDRNETKSAIKDSIQNNDVMIIYGDAGTGKSAIAKEIIDEYVADESCFVFALKADSLDKESLVRLSNSLGLKNRIDKILKSCVLNGSNILYVDSAEQLLEIRHWDTVIDFINLITSVGNFKIVFSTRSYSVPYIQTRLSSITSSFASYKIDIITLEELLNIAAKYESVRVLQKNIRINSILRVPFYLDYITRIESMKLVGGDISENDFRELLWEYIVEGSDKKISCNRSEAFMAIAMLRASQMQPFATINGIDVNRDILDNLVHNGLIVKENNNERYAPAHDILEDLALCRHINSIYNDWQATQNTISFYENIGKEPSIRRAYRLWATQKMETEQENYKLFVEYSLNSKIHQYWKDELLLVILWSNFTKLLLGEYCSMLISDNEKLLRRCILLMKVACKETDEVMMQLANSKSSKKYFPMEFLKPSGDIWCMMAKFIFKHKDEFDIKDKVYVDFIIDWSGKICFVDKSYPIEARGIGLLIVEILNHYKQGGYKSYKQQDLILILYKLSGVVSLETEELFSWAVEHKESYLGEKIIPLIQESQNWQVPCLYAHKSVINILRSSWVFIEEEHQKEITKSRFHLRNKSREEVFGFKEELSILKMGALGTPMFSLLDNHPWDSIKFLVELLNHSLDTLSKDENLSLELTSIAIEIEGSMCNQIGSERLWCMYRGATAECKILSAILMALEKMLLDYAKYCDEYDCVRQFVDKIFVYILSNCRNVASTSVIASVLMAYPKCWGDKVFSILRVREFYQWDLTRYSHEIAAENYSTDIIIAKERIESNSLPHRKEILRGVILQLSFDESNRQKCFDIIDNFIANDDKSEVNWSISLEHMDLRKQQLIQVSEDKIMLKTSHTPEVDEHIKEFNKFHSDTFLKPVCLSNWVHSVLKGNVDVAIVDWENKLDDVISSGSSLFSRSVEFAGIGIVFLWNNLRAEHKNWCVNNINGFFNNSLGSSDLLPLIPSMLDIVKNEKYIADIKILILNIVIYYQPEHMLNGFYASLRQHTNQDAILFYKSCIWGVANYLNEGQIDSSDLKAILNNEYSVIPENISASNINNIISTLQMIPNEQLSVDADICAAINRVHEVICYDMRNSKYGNQHLNVHSEFAFCIIYANCILRIDNNQDRLRIFNELINNIYNIVNEDKFNHKPIIDYFDRVMYEMAVLIGADPKFHKYFWQLWSCLFSFSREKNTKIFIESLMFEKICTYPYEIENWNGIRGKRLDVSECVRFVNNPILTMKLIRSCGYDELLPYLLPDIESILMDNIWKLTDCQSALEEIAFKLFADNKKRIQIKTNKIYSDSFISILDLLINNGSAKSFIIRDDFIARLAR
ncbi:trypsin-like peptidase domain-containing protein [Bacteroides neonati]|uniref:trypsin-like peptidase domain-containing protein n=1 Tax=Bacteroides neonati TaxID=1347393 RepID=UPI0004B947A9|nr:trypsin-like peptidase domain-containing protein [Bacteroides neonati]